MGTSTSQFIDKPTLKTKYGLVDRQIKLLGEPDRLAPRRSGPPQRLYLAQRVEQWIADHQAEVDAARARSDRATASAEVRRAETVRWAQQAEIKVQSLPRRVDRPALDYYNVQGRRRGKFPRKEVTHAGLVAYVRHKYTNYEALLADAAGSVGAAQAYRIIRSRVDFLAGQALAALGLGEDELVPVSTEPDNRFGPIVSGERVEMELSAADQRMVLQRGPVYKGSITDLKTGKQYEVYGRACDLPDCWCDSEAIEALPAAPESNAVATTPEVGT